MKGFLGRLTRPLKIKTTFQHRTTLRTQVARHTLIIHLHLDEGLAPVDPPPLTIYHHLSALMPGYVGYAKVPFHVLTDDVKEYRWGAERLVKQLGKDGPLHL